MRYMIALMISFSIFQSAFAGSVSKNEALKKTLEDSVYAQSLRYGWGDERVKNEKVIKFAKTILLNDLTRSEDHLVQACINVFHLGDLYEVSNGYAFEAKTFWREVRASQYNDQLSKTTVLSEKKRRRAKRKVNTKYYNVMYQNKYLSLSDVPFGDDEEKEGSEKKMAWDTKVAKVKIKCLHKLDAAFKSNERNIAQYVTELASQ